MKDYQDHTYGDSIASVYDELHSQVDPAMVDLLVRLAGEGSALELGIGTGRAALPLLEKGTAVHGIDSSSRMLDKLRAKPHGGEINLHHGSFEEFKLVERFQLIYVVFSTFFCLQTQEAQLRCFRCVSEHLASGGAFLLEVFVPDMGRFSDYQSLRAEELSEDSVHISASRLDPVTQQVTGQHIFLTPEGTRLYPLRIRYAWPAELDLMARLAGLRLDQRWGSWEQAPFTRASKQHISVYVAE